MDKKECSNNSGIDIDWELASEMYAEIQTCTDFKSFLEKYKDRFVEIDFSEILNLLIEKYNIKKSELLELANIEKSYFYQIISGRRKPSRNYILRISFALKLNLVETSRLLLAAETSALFPINSRDAALICCINQNFNLHDVQIFLHEMGMKTLD